MKPVLLLIDFQNDFLQSENLQPPAGQVVSRAAALLDGCRALSIPVIHAWTTMPGNDDQRMLHWKLAEKRACIEGTEGHATPDPLRPVKRETIIHKFYFSAFDEGKMDGILHSLDADTVLIAGVHLHVCVRAAVLDAYQRGFRVWVAEDAVASDDPLHASVTRRYLEARTTLFLTVKRILSLLNQHSDAEREEHLPPSLPAMICDGDIIGDDVKDRIVHISPRQKDSMLWSVPICDEKQVARAAKQAKRAWSSWRDSPMAFRLEILERLAALLRKESPGFVEQMAVEVGKPVTYGQAEVSRGVELLKAVAQHANDTLQGSCDAHSIFRYTPVGVVAIVTPWNNPLAIPVGKIAPALLYGNTVVWKPAPAASSIAIKIMDLFRSAGSPPGVVNLICGDRSTAEALISDESVDAVTITGSSAAGYSAQHLTGRRHIPLQAELGGNNVSIIWSDCDLESAAQKVAEAAFCLAGQKCTANRRVVIESASYDSFMTYFKDAVSALAWGDPMDPETQVGPLLSLDERDRVASLVSRARKATVSIFAPHESYRQYEKLTRTGAYFPPTVVCCDDPLHEIVQEETFGPVVVVQKASDWDHAMELCNGVKQGLIAALFSHSKDLQKKFLADTRAGVLKINMATAGVGVEAPFGGWKASGLGPPEHGFCNRLFYTRIQSIYHQEAF